ncbi:MAG TPA: F0F1 ATP synthase subunit B [Bacteroidota bacterium]
MLDLNPGLIVWTIVSFIVLVAILGKYAWKPLIQALAEREDKIRSALEQADRARSEAAELLKKNEENIARAEREYQKMVRESKEMAEKMKEEILGKARQQAEQELQRASDEIQRSVDSARQQLRAEVADLAIKAAEKILDESLDAQKQKKIVDSFIGQIPKN